MVSTKLSYYLSPQIYQSIFSGEKDAKIQTERKKLTIFFSDIADFTAITESSPAGRDLRRLLNEYFTAMAVIALKHGGTVDKFIGDAILDLLRRPANPWADGGRARLRAHGHRDAAAALAELNARLARATASSQPFRARIGINTGYCNVGNFGSDQRMEYTIIGAETNLAARLQSIADPGQIILSYESYVCVRDFGRGARPGAFDDERD